MNLNISSQFNNKKLALDTGFDMQVAIVLGTINHNFGTTFLPLHWDKNLYANMESHGTEIFKPSLACVPC